MRPIKVFYSYSHRDERYRDELAKHLSMLKRAGVIAEWHDRKIIPGAEWAGEIDHELERADIILLLVSADFIASDYCFDIELRRAMERHEAGSARVVPIIVRPVSWRAAPFGRLQALPTDGKPVRTWDDTDAAWTDIAEGIGDLIEQIQHQPAPAAETTELPTMLRGAMADRTRGFHLVVEQGLEAGKRLDAEPGDKLVIGRADGSNVRLPDDDREASRHHAWIEVRSAGLVVHDLKSKNGTFVNDRPITSGTGVDRGDRIRCGGTVILVEEAPDPDRTMTVLAPRRGVVRDT